MFIPPGKIYMEMQSDSFGIWITEVEGNDYPHIIAKLPTNVIKSIYNGIDTFLNIAIYEHQGQNILVLGLFIMDNLKYPYNTYQIIRKESEGKLFLPLLKNNNKEWHIHFFDELARPLVSSVCNVDKMESEKLLSTLNNLILYYGDVRKLDDAIFDKYKADIEQIFINKFFEPSTIFYKFKCEFIFSNPVNIIGVGTGEFKIDDEDEGGGLEQQIFQLIESLYGDLRSYRSPQIYKKDKLRELTDILAWDENHICIIESKVMSIFNIESDRISERFTLNIEKQIKKALNQLCGATKSIKRNETIFSQLNNIIKIPNESIETIHCIVIISEMYPNLNWNDWALKLIEINNKYKIMIHIIDLEELHKLIVSSKNPTEIRINLLLRWNKMLEVKSAFIRGKL
ncbi:hypothetical protein [Clostridium niameyense]|uniref:hypothetical protein n=1 Tax=Clostridium niameyense TaxID=1622073 RepID=UPI00067F3101|nr:hypothetical protein [Clostridium niameyense]